MRIEEDIKLDFKDVLFRPKRSNLVSRQEVELEKTYTFCHSKQTWTGVPIMAANMDTTGTFETAEALAKHKCITIITKHYSLDEWKEWLAKIDHSILYYISVCVGVTDQDVEKIEEIFKMSNDINFICCDVANGYSEKFVATVRKLRQKFPNKTLIAGNVVTNEMTEELVFSGADIVKVGIGSGSVCTTRKLTGVGYPQLSATIECSDAAHGLKGHIISDGGCNNPGDIAKAFGANTDFVMLGGMLAGHEESGGESITIDGQKKKVFYGMSSDTAMAKYAGGVAKYRSSEGRTVILPYRGPIEGTIMDILGGIRSTCTYVGAGTLKELPRRTTFIRVTQQLNEIYAHQTKDTGNRVK